MTSERGPSARRTIYLLCRLAGRRMLNRASLPFLRRRRGNAAQGPKRGATRSKNRASVLLLFAFAVFLIQSGIFAGNVIEKMVALAQGVDSRTTVTRGPRTYTIRSEERFLEPRRLPPESCRDEYRRALSLFFTLLFTALLAFALSGSNREFGQVEWSLEWLFTQPISSATLFFAKLAEYTFASPFCWVTCLPFFAMTYASGEAGIHTIPLAVAMTIYIALLIAAIRLVAEAALRRVFTLGGLKNVQALGTVLGILCFYTVLYLGLGTSAPKWFGHAFQSLPAAFELLPWNLPLAFATPGASAAPVIAWIAAAGILAACASVATCAFLVRGGLITASGSFQGRRGVASDLGARRGYFRGIIAKELLMLLRDRNLFVQLFVVPVLVMGFQVVIRPEVLEGAASDHRNAAMFAFGIGAYVLMAGAFSILTVEGRGLWLLYSFPRRLSDLLLEKAALWSTFSALYVVALLAWFAARSHDSRGAFIASAIMALSGILIYAFIAAGLGILGAEPLSTEPRKRLKPAYVYLYMFLASMFSFGIYSEDWWPKLVLVILCALLAFAIWQKVRDQIPYLLDPTASPPPMISTSDGLILGLMFFVVHGLCIMLMAMIADARGSTRFQPQWEHVIVAYVAAGLVTATASLANFLRRKVPHLGVQLGLQRDPRNSSSSLRVVMVSLASGALAVAVLVGYVYILDSMPFFKDQIDERKMELMPFKSLTDVQWYALLAVVAAPIFEEYIFRAVLFRGLRRTLPFGLAALASAAIFAICHPPISAVPVFCVGLATAFCFERTGLLIGPILVHTFYNVSVLFLDTLNI
ncbi:MAG: CPBP family intramembrane metalloprotease [Planctomycetes bacterium]|nr:CPBP family intramembrane metalloprotease [Planctomycetota bacterium]